MNDSALAPHRTLEAYYAHPGVKAAFLKEIFDAGAGDYDYVERLLSLGSGNWYRRQALLRAQLQTGMDVLDVAAGTGLVAREEIAITGSPRRVVGLDPSREMLKQAVENLKIRAALGIAEQIPMQSGRFDFLSMGYAVRHLADVRLAFAEFYRVLKPGGRVCLLEITAPTRGWSRGLLKIYMRWFVPAVTRLTTGRAASQKLWEYYWETIDACVAPADLLEALRAAGFSNVQRHAELGIFSEYTARKSE